ncbi:UDP-N-acetylmuramoylalanine--D-glutamate ligase [Methyloceanibacter methanicus]|uniref:UDP-N-acetylmuramoylalanine--D-glutamate ligase n=1 Tax=Methyloceanibacter methanicus TaxID=1774968 RepID=A0A1E3VX43_9HYPH|nr:UDP-N-acetylmuramoyl-L-alanine--D-glutamate ligase [Methyloceanibacter methanicus]ODR98104.1 UDP-N-acetylmuramoylalanine--D-glutamate ligase [Methyloceanibacter methanicus]
MIPVTIFAGRKLAVVGAGLSGLATARALQAGGADVVVWDDKEAGRAQAAEAGFPVEDLGQADFGAFAALVLAPGIPLTHPEPHWSVKKARAAGIEVIGDVELFFRARAAAGAGCKVIVITGTNGKSTTTALTAHLLESAGRDVALGGNIGNAVLNLAPFAPGMIYVLELSSYQIDLTPSLKPDAAALLNITPDHLDRHGSLAGYASVKARVFAQLGADGTAVIGIDDAPCRAIAETLDGPYAVKHVAIGRTVRNGVWAADATLFETDDGNEVARVDLTGIGSLRGAHNWQTAATAYALARSQGVDAPALREGLRSFGGLAHRMEQVARAGKVLFVNDSKATNADAAGKALGSFDNIYWIVGGVAKDGGLGGLEPFYPRIARAYLIGEAAEAFADQLGDAVPHTACGTLARAVEQAAEDASRSGGDEPVVLLSPACASFDQYANFVERGDAFRKLVMQRNGVTSLTG